MTLVACMAVRMVFDRQGRKRSHKFVRGLMRSAAKLAGMLVRVRGRKQHGSVVEAT